MRSRHEGGDKFAQFTKVMCAQAVFLAVQLLEGASVDADHKRLV